MSPSPAPIRIAVWRHPRPIGVDGRCVGRTDVAVDARKAKRLARRIQRTARREQRPRIVVTSPLRRCADVGRWLRRWGWVHRIESDLAEFDFGQWDGMPWARVPPCDLDAWRLDFARYRPGGGESLLQMLSRAAAMEFREPVAVVGHAGWICARLWLERGATRLPAAAEWPPSPSYGQPLRLAAVIGPDQRPRNPAVPGLRPAFEP